MENQKSEAGSWKEGFVESTFGQTENPCLGKGYADSWSFTNLLSSMCTVNVHSLNNVMNHAEPEQKISNGSVEEAMVSADVNRNNQPQMGALDSVPDGQVYGFMGNNEVKNNIISGFDKVEVGNVHDANAVGLCSKGVEFHGSGSLEKTEFSGSGINLFVEMFGPLDGMYEETDDLIDLDELNLEKTDSEEEHPKEGNERDGNLIPDNIESASTVIEDSEIGGQEFKFEVGDLVWVKTRSHLLWPAMVCDPSSATKEEPKSKQTSLYFVKHFGNVNTLWCSGSEMKPFVEYFDQLAKQNTSKIFISSVEKALGEFGKRVRAEMTCPCFSNEQSVENLEKDSSKASKFDTVSLPEFEPASFFECIRKLALSGSRPGKIEVTIIKNRLAAFYCSLGHYQIPMQQLRPISDAASASKVIKKDLLAPPGSSGISGEICEDDPTLSKTRKRNHEDVNKSDSSGKERERKKSKYLSYPYVDVIKGVKESSPGENDRNDLNQVPGSSETSTPMTKSSQRKGSMKRKDMVDKVEIVNVSSSELLSELVCTARAWHYPQTSKHSDLVKRYFRSFRQFVFSGHATSCIDAGFNPVAGEKENQLTDNPVSYMGSSEGQNSSVMKKAKPRKRVKKQEVLSSGFLGTTNGQARPTMINFGSGSSVPQSGINQVGKSPVLPNVDMPPGFPELKGHNLSFSVSKVSVEGPVKSQDKGVLKQGEKGTGLVNKNGVNMLDFSLNDTAASIPTLKDVQISVQTFPVPNYAKGVNNSAMFLNKEFKSGANMENSGVHMGIFPSHVKIERRGRKRKEKTTSQSAPIVPDLNGVSSESQLSGKDLPGDKPKKKRTRNKLSTAESFSSVLVLNFSPESPLPAKETLMKTFTRFGLLKEAETRFVNAATAHIVYERSADAGFAFRSLNKSNPFGALLASFNLHHVLDPSKTLLTNDKLPARPPVVPNDKLPARTPVVAARVEKTGGVKTSETPDLSAMKRDVEMMKSALERAGNSLSLEMRAKLENEIKGFLDKISALGGSPVS